MNDDKKRPQEQDRSRSARRRQSALVYLVILFAAAFLMLLLAYFMQQRSSEKIMGNLNDLQQSMGSIQSIDQLREENRALRNENRALREETESLRQQLADTQEQLGKVEAKLSASEVVLGNAWTSSETAWNIVSAFNSVYALRQLYEAGDIEGAKAFLDGLEEINGIDEVETGLCNNLALDPNWPEVLETSPPLVEWRELKAAILEAEIENEQRFT